MDDKKVSLKVNGLEIPLNPFVRTMVANVVDGLVESLDKIPPKKQKIELVIEEEETK